MRNGLRISYDKEIAREEVLKDPLEEEIRPKFVILYTLSR